MFRSFVVTALVSSTLIAVVNRPHAVAQDAEEGWKNLVIQALYAAGENQYAKSEGIFLKAVHEAERFGAQDVRVGTTLNSLGLVYRAEKKFSGAEGAYRRALLILEKNYGPDSIDVANVNFNVSSVLLDQEKFQTAVPFLQRTLSSYESILGGSSLKTASVYCLLGDSYRGIKSYPEAAVALKHCADIREADGGVQNANFAEALNSLARTYVAQGKYAQADSTYKLTEKIRENVLGLSSPLLGETLEDHMALLKLMGRDADAGKLNTLAGAIRRTQQHKKN